MTFEANDILAAHLAGFEGKAIQDHYQFTDLKSSCTCVKNKAHEMCCVGVLNFDLEIKLNIGVQNYNDN